MKKNTNNSSMRLKEKGIVMACSGASDVGELTDKIARKLGNNGAYQMKCLAMLSADKKSLIESLQQTKTLVIDGCGGMWKKDHGRSMVIKLSIC